MEVELFFYETRYFSTKNQPNWHWYMQLQRKWTQTRTKASSWAVSLEYWFHLTTLLALWCNIWYFWGLYTNFPTAQILTNLSQWFDWFGTLRNIFAEFISMNFCVTCSIYQFIFFSIYQFVLIISLFIYHVCWVRKHVQRSLCSGIFWLLQSKKMRWNQWSIITINKILICKIISMCQCISWYISCMIPKTLLHFWTFSQRQLETRFILDSIIQHIRNSYLLNLSGLISRIHVYASVYVNIFINFCSMFFKNR